MLQSHLALRLHSVDTAQFSHIPKYASAARTMLVGHCFSQTQAAQRLEPRSRPLVTFNLPPCKSAGAPAAQPITVSPD